MFLAFIKTLLMQIISNVQHQEGNKKIISLILHRYWSGSFVSTSAPARMSDRPSGAPACCAGQPRRGCRVAGCTCGGWRGGACGVWPSTWCSGRGWCRRSWRSSWPSCPDTSSRWRGLGRSLLTRRGRGRCPASPSARWRTPSGRPARRTCSARWRPRSPARPGTPAG